MNQLSKNSLLQGGKYRIVKVLGQGGFGITYLATQTILGKNVAIKEFFPKEYCNREGSNSRVSVATEANHDLVTRLKSKFVKEARNISRLDHPSIIKIHDIFEEHDTVYYVMDYIEGESLADKINHTGAIKLSTALDITLSVGEALKYVHSFRMNHLDVKPANIMIRRGDNRPILIDFGLAKQYDGSGNQTSTTPIGISPGYAPLEQYKSNGVKEFSPQTDVYSLAATLYKMLTGVTPPEAAEVIDSPLNTDQLPNGIADVIVKAMSVRKLDRYTTVEAFCNALCSASGKASNATAPVVNYSNGATASYNEATIMDNEATQFDDDATELDDSTAAESQPSPEYDSDDDKHRLLKRKIILVVAPILLMLLLLIWHIKSNKSEPDDYGDYSFAAEPYEGYNDSLYAENGSEAINQVEAAKSNQEKTPVEELTTVDIEQIPMPESRHDEIMPQDDPQETTAKPQKAESHNEEEIYVAVMQQAQFPGGQAALNKWVSNHINYPAMAAENDVQGRVVVKCVIEKDGSISAPSVVKGVDSSLDREALRVVKSMPRWQSAKNDAGVAVRSWVTIPVIFKLQN